MNAKTMEIEMKIAKLNATRALFMETQRDVISLLRYNGPMQRWQISNALKRKCDSTVNTLLKEGHLEQYKDINFHPNPSNKFSRAMAVYVEFVKDIAQPGPKKEVDKAHLNYYARSLIAAGWTVEPPNAI